MQHIKHVLGAGNKGILDLNNTLAGKPAENFLYRIANNCLPQIDEFLINGYTKEEMKMINETKKILNNSNLQISATCVRVPTKNCHCEVIHIELEKEFDILNVFQELSSSQNIVILDDITRNIYPINTFVDGKDEVFIGRIRRDLAVKNGLILWVVADNIRKGAATNAVQILEKLLKKRELN